MRLGIQGNGQPPETYTQLLKLEKYWWDKKVIMDGMKTVRDVEGLKQDLKDFDIIGPVG